MVRKHNGILHKVCLLYCNDAVEREDLYQEILLQAWSSVDRFRAEAAFSTWLYRVAVNTAVGRFRKHAKRPPMLSLDLGFDLPAQMSESEKERFEALYKAIATLNEIDKAIVALYLDDLDYKQIGEIMGITENYVGVKMNRIRKQLRERIQE